MKITREQLMPFLANNEVLDLSFDWSVSFDKYKEILFNQGLSKEEASDFIRVLSYDTKYKDMYLDPNLIVKKEVVFKTGPTMVVAIQDKCFSKSRIRDGVKAQAVLSGYTNVSEFELKRRYLSTMGIYTKADAKDIIKRFLNNGSTTTFIELKESFPDFYRLLRNSSFVFQDTDLITVSSNSTYSKVSNISIAGEVYSYSTLFGGLRLYNLITDELIETVISKKNKVIQALRYSIKDQTMAFRDLQHRNGINTEGLQVDHIVPFVNISEAWIAMVGVSIEELYEKIRWLNRDNQNHAIGFDKTTEDYWTQWHQEHASYRMLTEHKNKTRQKRINLLDTIKN